MFHSFASCCENAEIDCSPVLSTVAPVANHGVVERRALGGDALGAGDLHPEGLVPHELEQDLERLEEEHDVAEVVEFGIEFGFLRQVTDGLSLYQLGFAFVFFGQVVFYFPLMACADVKQIGKQQNFLVVAQML